MILVQITDTHIALDERGRQRLRDLEACVAGINGLVPAADAVIHTGDIAHNGAAGEYDRAAEILGALAVPLFVTAGNRDNRARLRRAFSPLCGLERDAGFVHYERTLPGLRLIALDSTSDRSNKGAFCAARLAWLRARLAGDASLPVVLFAHHAPIHVTSARDPIQYEQMRTVSDFARIMRRHTHIAALFCGHSHRSARGAIAGVPVSTAPSTAANLRQGEERMIHPRGPLCQIHTLGPDGRFRTETRAMASQPHRRNAV